MYTKSLAISALLSNEVSAVVLQYRPYAGSVPWQIPVTTPGFMKPPFPVNYPVPDFGVDTDIKDVSAAIKQSEAKLNKTMHADFGQTASNVGTPRNYFVPDFGVDHDIIRTTNSIGQTEDVLKKKFKASFGQTASTVGTPRNYVVPDFGVDHDILHTQNSIAISEKKLGKTLKADFGANASNVATPRNYVVPDFGVDRDITWTKNSIAQAQDTLHHQWKPTFTGGSWQNMPAVDANSSYFNNASSPELSAATKTNGSTAFTAPSFAQTSDPMPAVDANSSYVFGNTSPEFSNATKTNGSEAFKASLAQTSDDPMPAVDANSSYVFGNTSPEYSNATKTDGSTATTAPSAFTHAQTSDPMPAVDANSSYVFGNTSPEFSNATKTNGSEAFKASLAQDDSQIIDGSDVQLFSENGLELQSDPHCNSSGCTQYLFPKSKEDDYPKDYFVPNFGMDHDIKGSLSDLKVAEKQLDSKWVFHTEESKKQMELEQKIAKNENNYNMNPELDSDIIASQTNMKDEEKRLNHKLSPTYEGLIQMQDDPACSSAGCPKQEYVAKQEAKIVQYPVDVPLAEDIKESEASEGSASNQLAHAWNVPAWR